jgi:Helitron helicase-like domain at N-terminus/PIF1-like helicase
MQISYDEIMSISIPITMLNPHPHTHTHLRCTSIQIIRNIKKIFDLSAYCLFNSSIPIRSMFSFMSELYLKSMLNIYEYMFILHWHYRCPKRCGKMTALYLQRHLFYKHDFIMMVKKLLDGIIIHNNIQYKIKLLFMCYKCLFLGLRLNHAFQSSTSLYSLCLSDNNIPHCIIGGGSNVFLFKELQPYAIHISMENINSHFKLKKVLKLNCIENELQNLNLTLIKNIPLQDLLPRLTVADLRIIAAHHGLNISSKIKSLDIQHLIFDHKCNCENLIYGFEAINTEKQEHDRSIKSKLAALKRNKKYQAKKGLSYKVANLESVKKYQKKLKFDAKHKISHLLAAKEHKIEEMTSRFPPDIPTLKLQHQIITDACKDMSPNEFMESGCAVCGKLNLISQLIKLSDTNLDMNVLENSKVTQQERFCANDSIKGLNGPVLIEGLNSICKPCHRSLSKGKVPLMALSNGKWLGNVPKELADLSFTEQLLIAKVRHNRCIVKVSSGMFKMRANAISFANPIPKVYDILPPPIKELDEVLAFIYTGPCQPTKADFERTPLLVRRNKVKVALEWLKLNHCDYFDLEISQRNLDEYPEDMPPVVIDYRQSFTNKNPESSAAHETEEDEGTDAGKCSFVVHGLTGEEYSTKSVKALKAIALNHLTSNGKILAIGHESQPQSIYNNPQLFPQMMPWLFPYGLGGIGNSLQNGHVSDIAHKRHLLMYYDKRFQKDPYFPLIAFNHEQIKESVTAGYLLAEKSNFEDISKRLMDVDLHTLNNLTKRMEDGEKIQPKTDEEKLCFQLIKDLDHVGGHVKGSITNKKYMRNEIWSLISFIGAPSWFITFSPADNKHPISLYFADTKEIFNPEIRDYNERYRLIAQNPVAGARFFHFISQIFIKHVLGVGQKHPGIYGKTNAYYGTVEQQGRLTLHMHMLLWIKGSLSPQEIRNRIMDPNSDFQKELIQYLESVHVGEFLTGTMNEVKSKVDKFSDNQNYQDPTQTLPEAPPPLCNELSNDCFDCKNQNSWWIKFKHTVDDIVLRSNVHNCSQSPINGEKAIKKNRPTCINKHGKCKARFPRQIFEQTEVDPKTGALNVKKGEAWINTLTPIVTYLLRCNSDVTSLLSGTAVKAVVAYISDYVTKPGLKTYTIFDTIKSVFDRNSQMLGGSMIRKEKARRLITQIVNSLTSKMEIGGPMASLYLLGNPDHYTGHKFIPFYWKNYVKEVMLAWHSINDEEDVNMSSEKVVLLKAKNKYVGISSVYDYIYRPKEHSERNLYEWIQMAKRVKKKFDRNQMHNIISEGEDELDLIRSNINEIKNVSNSMPSQSKKHEKNYSSDELNIQSDNCDNCDNFIINDTDDEEYKEKLYDSEPEQELCFLKDHPLYETHVVNFDLNKINVVPNFIGGSLPRRDYGDREYYCATMLTLFKPWRNGKDLKSEDYSWDETFINHKFTAHQLTLMDNFNIRYECNDARDDYSAQLKRGDVVDGFFPSWMSSEIINEIDDPNKDDFVVEETIDDIDYGINKYSSLGPYGQIIKAQMDATENSIKNAGWLDDSPDGINSVDMTPFEPSIVQPGIKWKSIVQEKKQEILTTRYKHFEEGKSYKSNKYADSNENNVILIDQGYLKHDFIAQSKMAQNNINEVVRQFSLNVEQERAFRIVANHSVSHESEQLKMYLGGMGGTGKSQVIKALKYFFEKQNQSHRFIILGPTGTSAALLGGSTYHSFLGITMNNENRSNNSTISQVKSRLEGIDYIFIDEVSMLACHEMYKISSQLAKCLNIVDLPFGGINMIFAGDFAQLPPVGGASLYSSTVGTQVHAGLKPHFQEAAIGKALWHQVTTVVILRENMRQKTQTTADEALRSALVNMRYGACTPEDISFLRTKITGPRPEQPKVARKDFRNVAIICGVHTQKDKINQLGCERFAKETNQNLTNFYSVDKWGKEKDLAEKNKWGKSKVTSKVKHKSNIIDYDDQLEIWKLRHGATEHFPSKLSLCVGMPVMIRNNDATELCITKGQEGFVVGWQSTKGPHNKQVLDTLFVKLDNPPQTINIPGLPENVVPIVKSTKTVTCVFPSDLKESVERQQVWVLPNFAMTAHASQGKTRPYSVVHLNSCRTHMAYYTALSRSASAAGTIIIQGFDSNVITKGCSGYLRQEFREHEILDDITRLKYEGKLPTSINGHIRNTVIRQYQLWKGTNYVPDKTDKYLKWSINDPFSLLPIVTDSPWQLLDKSKISKPLFISTKDDIISNSKRKSENKENKENSENISIKKYKSDLSINTYNETDNNTLGLNWDADNYSCAYDSLFVILYNIWLEDPIKWTKRFLALNNIFLNVLTDGFNDLLSDKIQHLEDIRDTVRNMLNEWDSTQFPLGHRGTSVARLAETIFKVPEVLALSQNICVNCDYKEPKIEDNSNYIVDLNGSSVESSTSMKFKTLNHPTDDKCPECLAELIQPITYFSSPKILILVYHKCNIKTSHKIKANGKSEYLYLRGIIYYGQFHFSSRFISSKGDVWYHDGITTGSNCVSDGPLKYMNDDQLKFCNNKELMLAIYTQK